MEGTRHERASLVGVAYFIGFLTTFIWLGGANNPKLQPAPVLTVPQSASVIEAVEESAPQIPAEQPASAVSYINGALEINILGAVKTLSVNSEVAGIPDGEEFAEQGIHTGTLYYQSSPTDEYVFFCEMKAPAADTCRPFVYDAVSDSIFSLRKDGDRVDLLTGAASEAFWEGNILNVGGESSNDASQPWLLGLKQ
jgi:hypothetical protein